MTLRVPRERLLESPDCNLSGDRYRESVVRVSTKWPMVKLGNVCKIDPPKSEVRDLNPDLEVDFVPMSSVRERMPDIIATEKRKLRAVLKGYTYFRDGDVILAKITPCFQNRKCAIARGLLNGIGFGSTEFIIVRPLPEKILAELIYYSFSRDEFVRTGVERMTGSAGQQRVPLGHISDYQIPLPPLAEQECIVAELEGYRKIIEGARQIIANFRPAILIDPRWPRVKLGDLCRIDAPLVDPKQPQYCNLPHVSAENIESGTGVLLPLRSAADDQVISGKYAFHAGAVLYSKLRPYLCKAAIADFDGLCSADMYPLVVKEKNLDRRYLLQVLLSEEFSKYAVELSGRARMPKLNRDDLMAYAAALPPLPLQRQIVASLDAERVLVESNRKLIEIFEGKIKARLDEIWGVGDSHIDTVGI